MTTPVVIDASVAVEAVLGGSGVEDIAEVVGDRPLVAPAHLDAEVLSAVSRLVRTRRLTGLQGEAALDRFSQLDVARVPLLGLLPAALRLRDNVSAGDAPYVILARAMGTILVTTDQRLARAASDVARVPGGS